MRALDIIAISRERNECLLLEVKDFRDQNEGGVTGKPPSAPTQGQIAQNLAEQVAQKVAGSIAGLVGAARMQDTAYASDFARFLAAHRSEGIKVRVVLWIEGRPTSKGQSSRAQSKHAGVDSGPEAQGRLEHARARPGSIHCLQVGHRRPHRDRPPLIALAHLPRLARVTHLPEGGDQLGESVLLIRAARRAVGLTPASADQRQARVR